MAESAAGQAIVILSKDQDFAHTLAEQVKNELSLSCIVISDKNDLKQHAKPILAIVSSEMAPGTAEEPLLYPVIAVKNPPVRLQDILNDIAQLLTNDSPEDMGLGRGYYLQWRQKKLSHGASGNGVDLTDKEIKLLQSLAEAKGQAVGKDQLLKTIWGFGEALDTHTLETHIYRLRGKFRELAGDETMIIATEGGYKLEL